MKDLRQIVLDTETTGLDSKSDRIVEIGCVEVINRKLTHVNYHQYINPEMAMPAGAFDIHGISDEYLADKPIFSSITSEFIEYVRGAELIIHNASFDIAFLDMELQRVDPGLGKMSDYCEITDSLATARELHPGQRNTLDALATRYSIDNSHRKLHGALLDSEILAEVYLLMTGGQSSLSLEQDVDLNSASNSQYSVDMTTLDLPVIKANPDEVEAHKVILNEIKEKAEEPALWAKFSN